MERACPLAGGAAVGARSVARLAFRDGWRLNRELAERCERCALTSSAARPQGPRADVGAGPARVLNPVLQHVVSHADGGLCPAPRSLPPTRLGHCDEDGGGKVGSELPHVGGVICVWPSVACVPSHQTDARQRQGCTKVHPVAAAPRSKHAPRLPQGPGDVIAPATVGGPSR